MDALDYIYSLKIFNQNISTILHAQAAGVKNHVVIAYIAPGFSSVFHIKLRALSVVLFNQFFGIIIV